MCVNVFLYIVFAVQVGRIFEMINFGQETIDNSKY